ncbi:hypothetical protein F5148DRAFT_1234448 [Russula earlei]|uniref:Uncharacterized protein n=1 Tax=Russula earlei TaxID=71964 RepID=A0ACC0TXY5_9AGAM|nr:hypothetical protein F5148DRAFT_1234448 [Russula earlei]
MIFRRYLFYFLFLEMSVWGRVGCATSTPFHRACSSGTLSNNSVVLFLFRLAEKARVMNRLHQHLKHLNILTLRTVTSTIYVSLWLNHWPVFCWVLRLWP